MCGGLGWNEIFVMSNAELVSFAHILMSDGMRYLPRIADRLNSYEATYDKRENRYCFGYPFGRIEIHIDEQSYHVSLHASRDVGLSRLKYLATVAIKLYAGDVEPDIVWQGDNAGEQVLPQFRLMHVVAKSVFTPHMLRIRLAGATARNRRSPRSAWTYSGIDI